jgi:hypothetical protein
MSLKDFIILSPLGKNRSLNLLQVKAHTVPFIKSKGNQMERFTPSRK